MNWIILISISRGLKNSWAELKVRSTCCTDQRRIMFKHSFHEWPISSYPSSVGHENRIRRIVIMPSTYAAISLCEAVKFGKYAFSDNTAKHKTTRRNNIYIPFNSYNNERYRLWCKNNANLLADQNCSNCFLWLFFSRFVIQEVCLLLISVVHFCMMLLFDLSLIKIGHWIFMFKLIFIFI